MHSVTVRLRATEFSAAMTDIGEWLDANRYEPTRYKYDHSKDAVLVTVDFPTEAAAEAFATRFDGIRHSPQPTAPHGSPQPGACAASLPLPATEPRQGLPQH